MTMKMVRSEIPRERVMRLIDMRYKAFRDLKGRNPTAAEKKPMRDQIVKLAKRANQDGQLE